MSQLSNWAGNHTYRAAELAAPRSIAELQEIVAGSTKLKALGTRHSFNDIADTAGTLVSLEHFTRIEEPDRDRLTVTIEGGVRYGELCSFLHARGWALHNLASLPHISVAGAVATATHGSGVRNRNLATAVRAIEMITADGNVRHFPGREYRWDGVVVSLGALGVVTKLTLDLVPAFDVAQRVYQHLPLAPLLQNFDAIVESAYSVSLFTDWRSDSINQVWQKRRPRDDEMIDLARLGATPARADVHPIETMPAENCTQQMNVAGPWHERLPHFRLEFTPSAGEELQSEYFVAREHAVDAIRAINGIRDRVSPHLQISEIRTIAADELWMSPCYRRDSVAIHFTWRKDWLAVRPLLPLIESQLAPFEARPHWGKLFTMGGSELRALYPRLPDFRDMVNRWDPARKLGNHFLDGLLS